MYVSISSVLHVLQTKNYRSCDKQSLAVAVVNVLTDLISESSVCKVRYLMFLKCKHFGSRGIE